MKKLLLLLLFALLCQLSFAQPSDDVLLSRMNSGKMPGAAFVVIKDGKWIYSKNLGLANIATNTPVNYETIFMQASVSKIMIATAVMQLWEKGLIDLDADINHYLGFPVRTPSFPNDSITVRMLLTHTSSIKDEWNTMGSLYQFGDSPISLDSFMKNYFLPVGIYYNTNNFYTAQPGSEYNYSNMGSTLAAYLIERITGDLFSHYCDTAIFQKLCMINTSYLLSGIEDTAKIARPYTWYNAAYEDVGLYGYPDYPDGQLRTTTTDMARFMTTYMQYGIFDSVRILDSATIAYILQQQTSVDPDQGIIFFQAPTSNGDLVWGHNGGDVGVNTAMYFNPVKKVGVVVMTNGDGTGSANADLFANDFYLYGLTVTPDTNDSFPICGSTVGITEEGDPLAHVQVYPNPATTEIHILMPVDGSVEIYDVCGRLLRSLLLQKGVQDISLQNIWGPGLLLLHIKDENGKYSRISKVMVVK